MLALRGFLPVTPIYLFCETDSAVDKNSAGLGESCQREHDESMETMTKRGITKVAIDAYKDFLYGFMPVDVKIDSGTEAQAVDTSGRVLH